MEKSTVTQKEIGRTARKIAKRYYFTIEQLKHALVSPIKNHKDSWTRDAADYNEKTIHNYLYRSWPQMPKETTIEIISEAFEILLNENQRGSEAEKIKKAIAREIGNIYHEHTAKQEMDFASRTITEYLLTFAYTDIALFLSKNFEAFTSLSSTDIEFWDIMSGWDKKHKIQKYQSWCVYKANFQTIISPAFQQWVAIRNKSYAESAGKKRTGQPKVSQDFLTHLRKMTTTQADSLMVIIHRLKAREDEATSIDIKEEDSKEVKKTKKKAKLEIKKCGYPFSSAEQKYQWQ